MIEYKIGDILEEDAEALVNTVNCGRRHGARRRATVQKSLPRKFQSLRRRL